MVTHQEIDGIGTVLVDDTGRITVLSDACGELFDHALKSGMTADQLISWVLDQAEQSRTEGRRLPSNTNADSSPKQHVTTSSRGAACRRVRRYRHGYRDRGHQRHN